MAPSGMTGEQIYHNFYGGTGDDGRGLSATAVEVDVVAQTYADRADSIMKLTRRMEAAWQGEAGGAAQRGAGPLAVEHLVAAREIDVAQRAINDQVSAFTQAKSTVTPVPPVPDKPGFFDNLTTLGGASDNYENKLGQVNAANDTNLAAMTAYESASEAARGRMPSFTSTLTADQAQVGIVEPTQPPPRRQVEPPPTTRPTQPPGSSTPPGTGNPPGPGGRPPTGPGPGFVATGTDSDFVGTQVTTPENTGGPGPFPPPGFPPGPGGPGPGGPGPGGPGPFGPVGPVGPFGPGGSGNPAGGGPRAFGPGGSGFGPGGSGSAFGGPGAGGAGARGMGGFGPGGPGGMGGMAAAGEGAAARGGAGVGGFGGGGGRGGAGGMGMGGGRGRGDEDGEHERPTYLVEPDPHDTFGTDEITAPPVIGE